MIKWGKKVPEDFFINWSSGGHKDEWATIVSNDKGWWHAWEYPYPKNCLKECLEVAGLLITELLKQFGNRVSVTVCQI